MPNSLFLRVEVGNDIKKKIVFNQIKKESM